VIVTGANPKLATQSENRDGRLTSRDVDQLAASFEGLGISRLTHSSQDHTSGAAQVGCFYILKLTDLTLN
jgi:hypothetical protein